MTGYVNYFSATSLYAAWQAGIKPISPYVEAQLPDGSWQRIPGDAGFPAGLERTIVVDLTGKLPAGTRRIRLMTNLQIYWDQVLIDQSTRCAKRARRRFRSLRRRCTSADIRSRLKARAPAIWTTTTTCVSLTGPFQHERGNYTRMGDVTPLVKGIDDRFAIFGSGEEIAAEFDTSQAARAARALEARLLLLRQRICERHGLVGCVAVHRGATALPRHERLSLSGQRRNIPTMRVRLTIN